MMTISKLNCLDLVYVKVLYFIISFTLLVNNASSKDDIVVDFFGSNYDVDKYSKLSETLIRIQNRFFDYGKQLQREFSNYDAIQDFQSSKFKDLAHEIPVFISNTSINYGQFGNNIGNLFYDYACSQTSKAHYIGIWIRNEGQDNFFFKLPSIVLHQDPAASFSESQIISPCKRPKPYPWEIRDSPLLNDNVMNNIRRFMNNAIKNYIQQHYLTGEFKLEGIRKNYYPSNSESYNFSYPQNPDVTIHYRCGDNIHKKGMGLLIFHKIFREIPLDSKYIYIHTEGKGIHQKRCSDITQSLLTEMRKEFPKSVILIKYGAPLFEVLNDIINSRLLTICSASTFCLHISFGKTSGRVLFPEGTPYYDQGTYTFNYSSWDYMRNAFVVIKESKHVTTQLILNLLKHDTPFDPDK